MKILLYLLLLLIEVRLYQLGSAECDLYTTCTVSNPPLQEQSKCILPVWLVSECPPHTTCTVEEGEEGEEGRRGDHMTSAS